MSTLKNTFVVFMIFNNITLDFSIGSQNYPSWLSHIPLKIVDFIHWVTPWAWKYNFNVLIFEIINMSSSYWDGYAFLKDSSIIKYCSSLKIPHKVSSIHEKNLGLGGLRHGFCVVLAVLELSLQTRLALNSDTWLCLPPEYWN